MRHLPLLLLTLLVLALGGTLFTTPLFAIEPLALLCPTGQTTWLEGEGAPGSAVVAVMNQQPVGGSGVGTNGRWRIPIRPAEAPGIYAVEVRDRTSRAVFGRFTCYIDVPLAVAPTSAVSGVPVGDTTALPGATTTTPGPTQTADGTTTPAAPDETLDPTSVVETEQATPNVTQTGGTPEPTSEDSDGTQTVTATAGTGDTPTPTIAASRVQIIEVEAGSPDDNEDLGYVIIENETGGSVNLQGWELTNVTISGRPTYTFPDFTLRANRVVYVWTESDEDGQDDLFWNRTSVVWRSGDEAELRDANKRLISTFRVP